jgi:hypothetical protein
VSASSVDAYTYHFVGLWSGIHFVLPRLSFYSETQRTLIHDDYDDEIIWFTTIKLCIKTLWILILKSILFHFQTWLTLSCRKLKSERRKNVEGLSVWIKLWVRLRLKDKKTGCPLMPCIWKFIDLRYADSGKGVRTVL